MATYLVVSSGDPVTSLRHNTVVPGDLIDSLENLSGHTGWVSRVLERKSRYIDARLRKVCPVPFSEPNVPAVVRDWLARLCAPEIYARRGWDPTDAQSKQIVADRDTALAELAEAANGELTKYDLPAVDTADATIQTKGVPRYSADASPFVFKTRQRTTGRRQDEC